MKKTILSLILSASIVTVSPLFAMEDSNEPSHKTGIKRTASIDGNEELDKRVERAMALLEKIKDDKEATDTKKRHVRHDSFIVGTRVSF